MDAFRLAAVHRLLSSRYPAGGPGAALFLVVNDRPAMLCGFGLADVDAGEPVTPATLFDLASVAKHITAFALLMLVHEGKVSLDDELRKHIPELGRLDFGCRPFRVADLVFHCSGLPDYTCELEEDEYAGFTNARMLDWLAEQGELDFPTGSRGLCLKAETSTYCNTNYVLLATVIERVAGVGYAYFLKSRVFEPLGLDDTFCDPWRIDHKGQAKRYDASGRLITRPRVIPVVGDGNVYSTAIDLLRWDEELTRPTLLPQAWLDRIWQTGTTDDGGATDYAWGWNVKVYNSGRRVAWHGGSWDGANNCFSRWLDDGTRTLLLSNTGRHHAGNLVGELEEILLDR